MRWTIMLTFIGLLCLACGQNQMDKGIVEELKDTGKKNADFQAVSLLGKALYKKTSVDAVHLENHAAALAQWQKDPHTLENWIWYGRRTAYLGDYQEAVNIFTRAIGIFPDDARLHRHRGHRYITLRRFDEAVADFLHASELMAGKSDEIEADGLPNERNIPLSTLHGNVWYHLGLAYYLKNEMDLALEAYQNSLAASENDDMRVACRYWIYMILRRLGRGVEAVTSLESVMENLDIIENVDYYRLCLFFKGLLPLAELKKDETGLANYMNDALGYGLGNWYFFNKMTGEAEAQWRHVIEHSNWAGFACIAAEADYARSFRRIEPSVGI